MYYESKCRTWNCKWRCVFKRRKVVTLRLSSRRFQSFCRYLPTFSVSRNDFHRGIDIGRESSVEQANIRFCLFNFPEKWRGSHPGTPLRPFNQILSLELEYATRAEVTKEKNKFDQSEGGSYRFGYGFRKRRRILFLRKPDKGPFTRIFLHTRRLHLRVSSYVSRKRDENISRTVYRFIIHISSNSASEIFFCKLKKSSK